MSDRIDHAEQSREWIDEAIAEHHAGNESRAFLAVQLATAQGNLALVDAQREANEQARIANLIALATDATDRFGNYAGNGGIFSRLFDNPTTESGNVSVKPDIAAALGIQEEQS